MIQARNANALYSRPWMPNVGAYPGAPAGNALADMIGAGAMPGTGQPQPAAPVYSGADPVNPMGGLGEGTMGGTQGDMGYGMASPNQSLAGVVDALGNVVSFAANPIGTALQFGYQATQNPSARSASMLGNLSDFLGIGNNVSFEGAMAQNAAAGAPVGTQRQADIDAAMPGFVGSPQSTMGGGPVGDFGGAVDAYGGPGPDGVNSENSAGGPGAYGGAGGFSGSSSGAEFGWMRGGYTGDGPRAQPAGIVHRGEVVLNADATDHYGKNALLRLNRKAVPKNKLAALARP